MRLRPHRSPHGKLLAVSMMKDEAPYLLEWYAHHLAVGFTKILVYTNDCSDGTDDMLIRLEELGLGYHRRNDIPEGIKPQPSALKYAQAEPKVREADWVMVFDADEFLCVNYGDGTLDDMLDAAGDANGIVVTWRIFGSGNVVDWSRDPVTEQYLLAAPRTWNKGWGVKTLFKFDPEYWKLGIHRPSIKKRHLETGFPDQVKWLNGSGLPMEDYFKFRGWRSIRRTVGYQWAQMNHYAVKSIDAYAIRKFRGNVNNKKDKYNADYWSLQDRNEERDEKILRYKTRRATLMAALLEDPVLSKLHYEALERVEERLDAYRKTDAYEALKDGLIAAGQVPITKVVATPPKARDPAQIKALMSEVEKRNANRPIEERRSKPSPEFQDVEEGGDGFVHGEIDISVETAVDWVANHGIELPGDVRVFSPSALDLVLRGKYQRQPARLFERLTQDGDRVLDLGAGICFLSLFTCRQHSKSIVLAQEDNRSRQAVTDAIVARNGFEFGERFQLLNTQAIFPNDPDRTLSAVNQLIAETEPDVIRIHYAELAATLLRKLKVGRVRNVGLIGPAARAFHRLNATPGQTALPELVVLTPEAKPVPNPRQNS